MKVSYVAVATTVLFLSGCGESTHSTGKSVIDWDIFTPHDDTVGPLLNSENLQEITMVWCPQQTNYDHIKTVGYIAPGAKLEPCTSLWMRNGQNLFANLSGGDIEKSKACSLEKIMRDKRFKDMNYLTGVPDEDEMKKVLDTAFSQERTLRWFFESNVKLLAMAIKECPPSQ